jgi:hypothetical protein
MTDQSMQTVLVRKVTGYVPHRPDENSAANTRCLTLQEDVLYI